MFQNDFQWLKFFGVAVFTTVPVVMSANVFVYTVDDVKDFTERQQLATGFKFIKRTTSTGFGSEGII